MKDIYNYTYGLEYRPGICHDTIVEFFGDVESLQDGAVYCHRDELRKIYKRKLLINKIKQFCNKWLLTDFEIR